MKSNIQDIKKVLIVFGTRIEAIKMAPLIKRFQAEPLLDIKVCITIRHTGVLDQVLDSFNITADYDLNLMTEGENIYELTANVLDGMKKVLIDFKPDLVLVHGDTSTTFAASLSSYYQKIKVGHIEAGSRSGLIYSSWPKEANRQLITQITAYHFTSTVVSKQNLLKENISEKNIIVTGDTVTDALFLALDKIKKDNRLKDDIRHKICLQYTLNPNRKIVLVTGHKRESFGRSFSNICESLRVLAQKNSDTDIVYPVSLSEKTHTSVNKIFENVDNIHLVEPFEYEVFIYLMHLSHLIITDSIEVKGEALSLGKPVLVLMDLIDQQEAVEPAKFVGTEQVKIIRETQNILDNKDVYIKMSRAESLYSDGKASQRIVDFIMEQEAA